MSVDLPHRYTCFVSLYDVLHLQGQGGYHPGAASSDELTLYNKLIASLPRRINTLINFFFPSLTKFFFPGILIEIHHLQSVGNNVRKYQVSTMKIEPMARF